MLPILALWSVDVKVFTILWSLWWNLTISAYTIGKSIVLRFFWYPTFVYSTCVFGDTATLLCYVFLWSMVVDVKLFTMEKSYHLDHLLCSRPKLVIHCYLLKPLLIDRANSNNSNSGLITYYFPLSAVGKRRSPYRLFPDLISPSPSTPSSDGDDEAKIDAHLLLFWAGNGVMIATFLVSIV